MSSENMKTVVRSFYTTILSQIFSPCGNFLLAGNIYGEIFVFDLRTVLNPEHEVHDSKQRSYHIFTADENGQICSMASTDKFLIVGSKGKIIGFEWKHIIHGKTPKVAWTNTIPQLKDVIEIVEVNSLLIENNKIFAGCGDNKIHIFSLEDGRLIRSLVGHVNYVHDLSFMDNEMLASASEDGSVGIWDCRSSKVVSKIEPFKEVGLERPNLGKWIGFVDVEKDWLVCGGGPKAGLWHLRAMQLTTPFETIDKGLHACKLHEERVLLGASDKLNQFSLQGDQICSIPSSSSTIYSLILQQSPHHVMTFAGSSPDIDICTNFHYRDQVLSCRS